MIGQRIAMHCGTARSIRGAAAKVALATCIVALAACAAPGISQDAPAEAKSSAVKERVNGYWAALIGGDKDTAYTFLSPASRALVTQAGYKAKVRTGGFEKIEVASADCNAELCDVKLMLTYDHPKMKGIVTPVFQTWVLENGQFWLTWR